MRVDANLACILAVFVLVLSSAGTTSGFQLFGVGSSDNGTAPANSSAGGLTRSVQLLVRPVDAEDPYFRSMSFSVPQELNYMLGEYLHARFASMLLRHCNLTGNVTRLVRNNLQLLLRDVDVWNLQDGDQVEVWTNTSGPPTRAETAKAFAKPMRPPGRPGMPPRPRPCPPGRNCQQRPRPCPPGRDCPPRGRSGGRPDRRERPGAGDRTVELSEEMPVEGGDEPIVVPDFSEMDDF